MIGCKHPGRARATPGGYVYRVPWFHRLFHGSRPRWPSRKNVWVWWFVRNCRELRKVNYKKLFRWGLIPLACEVLQSNNSKLVNFPLAIGYNC